MIGPQRSGKASEFMKQSDQFGWITKRFVWLVVFTLSTVGPTIGALIYSFFDQSIRNFSDRMTGGPDLFHQIVLSEEQYNALSLEWRQTLAEVALRPEDEAANTKRIVQTLALTDLELIGRLAPFLVGRYIARDERLLSEHPIPGVAYVDMRRLEEVGIVDDTNFGMRFTLESKGDAPSKVALHGTTLSIVATGPAKDIESKIELTRLTVPGAELLKSLRVPSNVEYFEWIAENLERDGWAVDLVALGTPPGHETSRRTSQALINRSSISNWDKALGLE